MTFVSAANFSTTKLLAEVEGLKVSLIMPTHRHAPDNVGDPTVAANLVRSASQELAAIDGGRGKSLSSALESAVNQIDWNRTKDGLLILVGNDFVQVHHLNHQPVARVVVAEHFAISELVRDIATTPNINVLALSELPTKFFTGKADNLLEVVNEDFPAVHDGPGGLAGKPTGFGQQTSVIMDERHKQFFRRIEQAVLTQLKLTPAPLFVLGVDRYLAFWREVAPQIQLAGQILGNFDYWSIPQLQDMLIAAVNDFLSEQSQAALVEIEAAASKKQLTFESEIDDVANMGKMAKLVFVIEATAAYTTHEAAIYETLLKGGSIEFLQDVSLPNNAKVVGIARY